MAERCGDARLSAVSVFLRKTGAVSSLGSVLVQGTCEHHHSLLREHSFVVDQAAPMKPLDCLRILVSQTAAAEKPNQQALF
jgi:hypothetical protein